MTLKDKGMSPSPQLQQITVLVTLVVKRWVPHTQCSSDAAQTYYATHLSRTWDASVEGEPVQTHRCP